MAEISDARQLLLPSVFNALPDPPQLPENFRSRLTPVEKVQTAYLSGTKLPWLSKLQSDFSSTEIQDRQSTSELSSKEPSKTEQVSMEQVKTEQVKTERVKTGQVSTEQVSTEQVITKQLSTEQVSTEQLSTEQVSTEQLSTEQVSTEQLSTEQVSTERMSTEQVSTEQLSTEQVSTEPLSTEQVSTERMSTEQVSTEQLSTEQVRAQFALRHVHGLKFKLTSQNVSRSFLPDRDRTVPCHSPSLMTSVERPVCDFRVAVPVRVQKDGRRYYKCSSCELHKVKRASIWGHINQQKGDILQCGHCQYNTPNPDSFKRHQRHCGDSRVERPVCDFRVAVPVRVQKDGRRYYKCSSCELHKVKRASIWGHINQQKGDILQCGHCQYNTPNPDSFKRHQRHCGDSGVEYFSCDQCDFKTSRPSHLIRHRLAHSKPKLFSCPHCSSKFSLKWNLRRHKQQFHSNVHV